MNRRFTAALAVSLLLASSAAFAQTPPPPPDSPPSTSSGYFGAGISDASPHLRPSEISVMAYLPYTYGLGIGVTGRFSYPILPNGFLPEINDSFDLEGGVSFAYGSYYAFVGSASWTDLIPHVMGTWRFFLLPHLDLYLGLAFGADIFLFSGLLGTVGYAPVGFFWNVAGGLHYRFSNAIELRAEVGYRGLQVGISLPL